MPRNIFTPPNAAKFRWDKWSTLRGMSTYVFSYRIEKERGYVMRDARARKECTSAYTGFVYADAETREIQRITMKVVDVPSNCVARRLELRLDYKPTEIAGHIYTLPSDYQLESDDREGHHEHEVDFKSYQVYGADVTLKYGGTGPPDNPPVKKQP
jgi:hypothetical protein